MAIVLRLVSGAHQRVQLGYPATDAITVQALKEDGAPAAGVWVTFIAEPPGALRFGDAIHGSRETNAQGMVGVIPFGNMIGDHAVIASIPSGTADAPGGRIPIPIRVTKEDVTVQTLPDGRPMIIDGRRDPPPAPSPPRQPLSIQAAALIFGLALLFLVAVWMFFGTPTSAAAGTAPTPDIPAHIAAQLAAQEARATAAERELAGIRAAFDRLVEDTRVGIAQSHLSGRIYTNERIRLAQLYSEMRPELEAHERALRTRMEAYHSQYGMTSGLSEICQHPIGRFLCERIE